MTEKEYQSDIIKYLITNLGYSLIKNTNKDNLINNLRFCLEKINNGGNKFDDEEWKAIYSEIMRTNLQIDRFISLKKEYIQSDIKFTDKNGNKKSVRLVDLNNTNNNIYQVAQEVEIRGGIKRFDVVLFLNGLPICIMELKIQKNDLDTAYNQMVFRYQSDINNDDLFRYTLFFIISKKEHTEYFANTEWNDKYHQNIRSGRNFSSWWKNENNEDVESFYNVARDILNKEEILNFIKRYLLIDLNEEKGSYKKYSLLVMRPYQIHAMNKTLDVVKKAVDANFSNDIYRGGYIWHATGSGKTITSYKIAETIINEPDKFNKVDKVIFVVDRKELKTQTIDRFSGISTGSKKPCPSLGGKGAKNLISNSKEIIVTTIQALNAFCREHFKKYEKIINKKNFVFIFDECHRSNSGQMQMRIKEAFKNKVFIGFTGTPCFTKINEKNLDEQIAFLVKKNEPFPTKYIFGEQLHKYTTFHALLDQKVVEFVPYYRECSLVDSRQIRKTKPWIVNNVAHIIKEFCKLTKKEDMFVNSDEWHKNGYNAILVASSVDAVIYYYDCFKRIINSLKASNNNIGCIKNYFKFTAAFSVKHRFKKNNFSCLEYSRGNYEVSEEKDSELSLKPFEFNKKVKEIINDFYKKENDNNNKKIDVDHTTFIRNVGLAFKEKKIDLLIVCNMFTTGFDAPGCNTIFIDREYNDDMQLFQTISRVNRISLNKKEGNIWFFDNQENKLIDAFRIYSGVNNFAEINFFKNFNLLYSDKTYKDVRGNIQDGYITLVQKIRKFKNGDSYRSEKLKWDTEYKNEFIFLVEKLIEVRRIIKFDPRYYEIKPELLTDEEFESIKGVASDIAKETKYEFINEKYNPLKSRAQEELLNKVLSLDEFREGKKIDAKFIKNCFDENEKNTDKKSHDQINEILNGLSLNNIDDSGSLKPLLDFMRVSAIKNLENIVDESKEIKNKIAALKYASYISKNSSIEEIENINVNDPLLDEAFGNSLDKSIEKEKMEFARKIRFWKDSYRVIPDLHSSINEKIHSISK